MLQSTLLLLSPIFALAITLDCTHMRDSNHGWDLSPLSGPKSVQYSQTLSDPTMTNTTFTIDICKPLKKKKGVPSAEDCENGSRGAFNLDYPHQPSS